VSKRAFLSGSGQAVVLTSKDEISELEFVPDEL
jgi:hypothetical protein